MSSLTPRQAARVIRVLLQHIKKDLEANPQFTVSNLMTLLAVVENPGAVQSEIGGMTDAGDAGVLSRQLRYLRGKRSGVVLSPLKPVVRLVPLETDNRVNVCELTDEGEEFAAEMARTLNRLLQKASKQNA